MTVDPRHLDPGRLDLFRRGEAFFLDALAGLPDDALSEPSGLEGWTRRHVVAHMARNAAALGNLLTWARTGIETPMYGSAEDRAQGIEDGAGQPPLVIRSEAVQASARLVDAVVALPAEAWVAEVRTVRGRAIEAIEVPWMRTKESWIHTIDLGAGATCADLPPPLVDDLLEEVAGGLAGSDRCPPMRLVEEGGAAWRIGPSEGAPVEVIGSASALVGWLIGRSAGDDLRAPEAPDGRPPRAPDWF